MIDTQVFMTSREAARLKLSPEVARSSFGYHIDIASNWERYRSPEELINNLAIHRTHMKQFTEIIEDLGQLSDEERDWIKRYVSFYEGIIRLLSTTGYRVDLKHDIAETLFDWRTILKFAKLPCRILDFGAGCARQGVSAFLRDNKSIYTAVDSVLGAYYVQNLVLSYMDTLAMEPAFADFLDYEMAGLPLPKISQAKPGNCFHIPTWMLEENIPEKFFDIIIMSHVHNELSKYDFLRLVTAIDKGLAPDGIAYVRSEVSVLDPKDYFDAVDLHAIDIVAILLQKGIVPVYCKQESAFLTTVFARKNSSHHKAALKSNAPENSFLNAKIGPDLSIKAADHFVERNLKNIIDSGARVVLIGEGNPFYERFIAPVLKSIQNKQTYRENQFLSDMSKETVKEFASFNPDIIVIASHQYGVVEEKIKNLLPGSEFPLRRNYWYPVVFLYGKSVLHGDDIFSHPILVPKDLKG